MLGTPGIKTDGLDDGKWTKFITTNHLYGVGLVWILTGYQVDEGKEKQNLSQQATCMGESWFEFWLDTG